MNAYKWFAKFFGLVAAFTVFVLWNKLPILSTDYVTMGVNLTGTLPLMLLSVISLGYNILKLNKDVLKRMCSMIIIALAISLVLLFVQLLIGITLILNIGENSISVNLMIPLVVNSLIAFTLFKNKGSFLEILAASYCIVGISILLLDVSLGIMLTKVFDIPLSVATLGAGGINDGLNMVALGILIFAIIYYRLEKYFAPYVIAYEIRKNDTKKSP
jgi:hypothetical protein